MFDPDLLKVDFKLLRDQHRDRGVGTLPHLDIRHGQHDLPIGADTDEGVRCKALGTAGPALVEWQAHAEHQAAASYNAVDKETATREVGVSARRAAIESHLQPSFSTIARRA